MLWTIKNYFIKPKLKISYGLGFVMPDSSSDWPRFKKMSRCTLITASLLRSIYTYLLLKAMFTLAWIILFFIYLYILSFIIFIHIINH